MRILIDTHILLWHMNADDRLKKSWREEIENDKNTIYLSKASLWEIAVKLSLKKLAFATPFREVENYLAKNSFEMLDFGYHEFQLLTELPFYHGDPFDRIIISQAIHRTIHVISSDKKFSLYPIQLLA